MRGKNDKVYKNFWERWEWLITFMVVEDKFVHNILMMMDKSRNDSVKTMGVRVEGTRIFLVYNQAFIDSLSDAELRWVITHEVYHLVLHHCTKRAPIDKKDHDLFNQGADLAINTLIPRDANRALPVDENGKPFVLLPAQHGFAEKLSMEQYVQLLREQQEKDGGGKGGNGVGGEEGGGEEGGEGYSGIDNHDGWQESDVIAEIVRNAINKIAKDERVWGKMPGELKAIIMAAQQSYVTWERYLKHYLGQMVSAKSIRTMKRPDRRFGYPYAGKKRGYTDRKLVAIDSSGSVGEDELAQFLCEVNKLAEIQPVDLLVFDDGIQLGPIPFNRKHSEFDIPGRGGTSFHAVFKLAEERRYQTVIMLTDGCAAPCEYPNGVRDVLWVLTGPGNPPVDWGERVRIVPKGTPQDDVAKAA
jgi:predicted metal-dependent peptidase